MPSCPNTAYWLAGPRARRGCRNARDRTALFTSCDWNLSMRVLLAYLQMIPPSDQRAPQLLPFPGRVRKRFSRPGIHGEEPRECPSLPAAVWSANGRATHARRPTRYRCDPATRTPGAARETPARGSRWLAPSCDLALMGCRLTPTTRQASRTPHSSRNRARGCGGTSASSPTLLCPRRSFKAMMSLCWRYHAVA